MSLLVSWLIFPLVLGVLSLGCGLLVERAAGCRVQRELVLPLGFATIVVASLFTTASSRTAHLTTPLVVGLAVAGLGLALPWRPKREDGWAAGCAAAVYAAFGAPVFLSGSSTFAGYIKLDDTSTWLAFTDRLLDHGRNSTGLAPSTYEATLTLNLTGGYPVGAFPPLGVVHELMGTDSAWLFQPYVAFLAAMLALGIYGVLAHVIESRGLRAAGRLHRRAARAALRLFPLGRAEGGCVRCDPDSRRRAHAARARTGGASSQCRSRWPWRQRRSSEC